MTKRRTAPCYPETAVQLSARCCEVKGWSAAAAEGDIEAFMQEAAEKDARAAQASAATALCGEATSVWNVDAASVEHARFQAIFAAMELEDAAACVVARLDRPQSPSGIKLERPISTEHAARLINELAATLERMTPMGAEVIRRIAGDVAREASIGKHLLPETLEATARRMQKDHLRALDALTYVSGQHAEKVALAVESIRQAAARLVPEHSAVPLEPPVALWDEWIALGENERAEHIRTETDLSRRCFHWSRSGANGWVAAHAAEDAVARGERNAIASLREQFPALTADKMADADILNLLHPMTRPQAPSRNSEYGKATLAQIKEENEHRRAAKLRAIHPITLEEQARLCLPVLRLVGLAPPSSGDPIAAIAEALDDGWKPREEHWGSPIRDRKDRTAATRPSVKVALKTAERRSADSRKRRGQGTKHDPSRRPRKG